MNQKKHSNYCCFSSYAEAPSTVWLQYNTYNCNVLEMNVYIFVLIIIVELEVPVSVGNLTDQVIYAAVFL